MAGSGEPVEFSVDRSAEEGTPMVAMAALDAGGSASSNYARAGQPYRAEKRLEVSTQSTGPRCLASYAACREMTYRRFYTRLCRLLFGSRRCLKRFGPGPFLMGPLVRQRHSARRDLAGEGRGPDPYHRAVAFCMLFHPALDLLRPADRRDALYRPTLVNSRLTRRDFCCGLGADPSLCERAGAA